MSSDRRADDPDGWERHRRAGVRGVRGVLAVVAIIVAAAALAGGGSALPDVSAAGDRELAVERGSEPLDLAPRMHEPSRDGSSVFRCIAPFVVAAYSRGDGSRTAYVAGHPDSPPSDVRPDGCFDTSEAAQMAGYAPVALPRGDVLVDGVVMADTGTRYARDCESAAADLGHVVVCPRWLPRDAGGSLPRCSELPPGGRNRCLLELPAHVGGARGFAVATVAAGLPPAGSSTATLPGLLIVASSLDPHSAFIACTPEELAADGPTPQVGLTDCPPVDPETLEQSLPHAGRRTTRFQVGETWVAVSFGTPTRPLDEARQLVIRGLYAVTPDRQS